MTHVLIEKLHRYKTNAHSNDPEDYEYDSRVGYWRSTKDGAPLVSDETVRKPRTKKADIETGEDKKGE